MIASLLYKLGAYLALRLPERISFLIVRILADTQYVFRFKTRRNVFKNLRIIHGDRKSEKELHRQVRKIFRNFAKSIYLFLRIPRMDMDNLKVGGDADDFKKLAGDLTQKGGFIVVSAHLGPWEMGGVWLATCGLNVNTVALDHPAEAVTTFFNQRRELSGLRIFPSRQSFGDLKDALSRSECVALLVDRAYGGASKCSQWFGLEKDLPIGHLLLAYQCRVPVLTGAFVFDSGGGIKSVIEGLHFPDPNLSEVEAIDRLHLRCVEDLETLVRTYSDQWFQFFPLEGRKK